MLYIRSLGSFSLDVWLPLTIGFSRERLRRKRSEHLIQMLLCCSERSAIRERLADILYPYADPTTLRIAIMEIELKVVHPYLSQALLFAEHSRKRLTLHQAPLIRWDVEEFVNLVELASSTPSPESAREGFQRAHALLRGPLFVESQEEPWYQHPAVQDWVKRVEHAILTLYHHWSLLELDERHPVEALAAIERYFQHAPIDDQFLEEVSPRLLEMGVQQPCRRLHEEMRNRFKQADRLVPFMLRERLACIERGEYATIRARNDTKQQSQAGGGQHQIVRSLLHQPEEEAYMHNRRTFLQGAGALAALLTAPQTIDLQEKTITYAQGRVRDGWQALAGVMQAPEHAVLLGEIPLILVLLDQVITMTNTQTRREEALATASRLSQIQAMLESHRSNLAGRLLYAKKAVTYSEETTESPETVISSLRTLGSTYDYQGNYEKMLETFQRALSVVQEYPLYAVPVMLQDRVHAGLAGAYAQLGQSNKSLYYLSLVEERIHEHREVARTYDREDSGPNSILLAAGEARGILGRTALLKKNQQDASTHFEKGFQSLEQARTWDGPFAFPRRGFVEATTIKAGIAFDWNEPEAGVILLSQSAQIATEIGSAKRRDEVVKTLNEQKPRFGQKLFAPVEQMLS